MKETMNEISAAIEALLFTMGESISADAMAGVLSCDRETVLTCARELMHRYSDENRGIRIIELDGSFQMCTSPAMYDYVIGLTHQPKKQTLTGVMLETLAIIAYKQPVTRAEIEQIRGVSCSHAINKLLEYNLIMEAGRMNAPGRPILFGTTEDFLRTFGVRSSDDLPIISPEQIDEFKTEAEEEVQLTIET